MREPAKVMLQQAEVLDSQDLLEVEQQDKRSAVPSPVRHLDGAWKWLVAVVQTSVLVLRHDTVAPWVVIGAIAAAYLSKAAKKVINQQRPDGSQFVDPGMPSNHATVTTFLTASWAFFLASPAWTGALMGAAVLASVLRVVNGHHTWAQVGVGAAFGSALALGWMKMGAGLVLGAGGAASTAGLYSVYLGLTVLFVRKTMRKRRVTRTELMAKQRQFA